MYRDYYSLHMSCAGALISLFKIFCLISTNIRVDHPVKTPVKIWDDNKCYNGLITTDAIIIFNNIFKNIIPNWGEPIIISKSCNVFDTIGEPNRFKRVKAFFDNVEIIPGKMRKAFTKRKTKSVNDKSKTSNRKIFFNKFNTPKSNARTHKLKHKKIFISSSQ